MTTGTCLQTLSFNPASHKLASARDHHAVTDLTLTPTNLPKGFIGGTVDMDRGSSLLWLVDVIARRRRVAWTRTNVQVDRIPLPYTHHVTMSQINRSTCQQHRP